MKSALQSTARAPRPDLAGPGLAEIATGRATSLFAADMARARQTIATGVTGKRLLAIGAAGSIGGATVAEIAAFAPAALHIIDHNENELAEVVRRLRSRVDGLAIADFRTLPLDYGAPVMRAFLADEAAAAGPYDAVLNFAAIKHVRSEKDPYSVLQMFDTNIVKQARFLRWLGETGFKGRYFSVSTDKAANPTSMMGASKRVMEHVLFDAGAGLGVGAVVTSARFANVAFSNGSLLQSFERRLAQGQPLAAPKDTRRYFVSLKEAGELCLIAATAAPDRHILIPLLDPQTALVSLETIAEGFLRFHGFEPTRCSDEDAARSMVERERARGRWPLLLTALTTSGEKPYEEFVGADESVVPLSFDALAAVPYRAPRQPQRVAELVDELGRLITALATGTRAGELDKEHLKKLLGSVEPAFLATHRETGLNLDQRV